MSKLEKRIHDAKNGLDYVLVGDCYIPALIFPEESRPIGKWGRMHRAYLKERHPGRYNALLLSGKLETYLADLDEQAQARFEAIVCQMKDAEKITEDLKARDWLGWLRGMNSIANRAKEILREEMICL